MAAGMLEVWTVDCGVVSWCWPAIEDRVTRRARQLVRALEARCGSVDVLSRSSALFSHTRFAQLVLLALFRCHRTFEHGAVYAVDEYKCVNDLAAIFVCSFVT